METCGPLKARERAADALDTGLRGFLEEVLPDADDFPSLPAELAVDPFIAGHVVGPFFIPKCPVGLGAGVALGAAVPKTSVDEDGDFLLGNRGLGRWPLGKREVGLSG